MKTNSCRCCSGSGRELDHTSVGAEMKALRKKHGLSQEVIARSLKCTVPYISSLELGNRNWSAATLHAYKRAVETNK